MNSVVATVGALAIGVALVGCGDATHPRLDPDGAGRPTWGHCRAFSVGFLDYVADAPGASTPRQAIARYRLDGDHVVISPHAPRQGGRWLLVDDHNLIRTSLGLQHDEQGWLVDEVKSCGDRKSGAPAVR